MPKNANRIKYKDGILSDNNKRLYRSWSALKNRCYNIKNKAYKHYGGRGITVCNEWLNSFELFFKWASENGYAENLTIERLDVNGNYEPDNCTWATRKEQANNRTNTVYLTINGETKNVINWCIQYGITPSAYRQRIKHGWPPELALTTSTSGKHNKLKHLKK